VRVPARFGYLPLIYVLRAALHTAVTRLPGLLPHGTPRIRFPDLRVAGRYVTFWITFCVPVCVVPPRLHALRACLHVATEHLRMRILPTRSAAAPRMVGCRRFMPRTVYRSCCCVAVLPLYARSVGLRCSFSSVCSRWIAWIPYLYWLQLISGLLLPSFVCTPHCYLRLPFVCCCVTRVPLHALHRFYVAGCSCTALPGALPACVQICSYW